MSNIGYARVSSAGQDLEIQIAKLKAAGCEPIRSEKQSGKSTAGRAELANVLAFLQRGDTLTVTKIDRLARSVGDLQDIMRQLEAKGVALKSTDQTVDTSTSSGRAFLGMLSIFAEFENDIRRERQFDGIAAAKAEGVYKGRKRSISVEAIKALKDQGLGNTAIAKRLKIARASVYRLTA